MKRFILAVLILGLMVSTAFAGDYTVTLTNLQEQGLKYVTDKYNAAQVQQYDADKNPIPIVPVTKGQYIKAMIKDVVNDYIRQGLADDASNVSKRYEAATDAQKAQIKVLLGL